ncbi:MAG: MFS transporter, partial [Bacteroidales bacterium]|nr:MFS transporter [Bacteroidales bacterium]
GMVIDRFSLRLVLAVGGVAFGSALMLISRSDSLLLMLLLIGIPLTFGAAACGVLGANTLAARWFQRRRGRALGILAISTSVGGFISQPVTALLIEAFGWRDALFLLGMVATLVFSLMALLVIRDRPQTTAPGYEKEFSPAASSMHPSQAAPHERPWSPLELIRNRNFCLMSLGIGLLFSVDQALLASQVPFFQDMGFDLTTAALLVSVKTFSAIGGKLIVGALADRVDLRWLYAYVAGSNVLLLTIYVLQPSFWVLLASVALLGVAVGGVFPIWTTIIAWLFGARSYGTVMGLMSIVIQILAVVSMRFVGEVYDRTGSYLPAFSVYIGLVLLSIALIAMLRPDHGGTGKPPG